MPSICEGCSISFNRNGLYSHLRQSKNPRCHAYLARLDNDGSDLSTCGSDQNGSDSRQSNSDEDLSLGFPLEVARGATDTSTSPSHTSIFGPAVSLTNIDPLGDFYGDYGDYSMDDFGMDVEGGDSEGTSEEDLISGEDSDQEGEDGIDDDAIDASLVGEERGLEPKRAYSEVPAVEVVEEQDHIQGPAVRLRGGEEVALRNKPFTVRFPRDSAGAVHARGDRDQNALYFSAVGEADNPYAPFCSKMEWDIARWSKLRGPSSTALTELMAIEGVSTKFSYDIQQSTYPLCRSLKLLASHSKTPVSSTNL